MPRPSGNCPKCGQLMNLTSIQSHLLLRCPKREQPVVEIPVSILRGLIEKAMRAGLTISIEPSPPLPSFRVLLRRGAEAQVVTITRDQTDRRMEELISEAIERFKRDDRGVRADPVRTVEPSNIVVPKLPRW